MVVLFKSEQLFEYFPRKLLRKNTWEIHLFNFRQDGMEKIFHRQVADN